MSSPARGSVVARSSGPAAAADLDAPAGVAVGLDGAVYIAEAGNHRITVVRDGALEVLAGLGQPGLAGDGGPPRAALLEAPRFIAVDAFDRVSVVEERRGRIRRIDPATDTIDTIAGRRETGFGPISDVQTDARALRVVPLGQGHVVVSIGPSGRVSLIHPERELVELVVVDDPTPGPADSTPVNARQAPLILNAGGLIVDGDRLLITGQDEVRSVDFDRAVATPSAWISSLFMPTSAARPGGLVFEPDGSLLVVDGDDDYVRRFLRDSGLRSSGARGLTGFIVAAQRLVHAHDDLPAARQLRRSCLATSVGRRALSTAPADARGARRFGPARHPARRGGRDG